MAAVEQFFQLPEVHMTSFLLKSEDEDQELFKKNIM